MDPFEIAVRAILGQQVTVKGHGRWRCGSCSDSEVSRSSVAQGITRTFPDPADLAGASIETIGIPSARAEAIRSLAPGRALGQPRPRRGRRCRHRVGALTRLPGVGDWTAGYIAMRAFGEPDVFPPGTSFCAARCLTARGSFPRRGGAGGRGLAPWRSYAVLHIWTQATSRKERHEAQRRRA